MHALVLRRASDVWSAVLTVAAVLGSVCLLTTLLAPVVGVRPLIFVSGSMSPTIPAGSLALARTTGADELEVGDIVTVPSNGAYVTHRIVDITHGTGKANVLLRGDGNTVVDATAYEITSAPRTVLFVPRAGTVVAWFSHAPGVYVLAAWVAVVLGSLRRRRAPDGGAWPPSRDRLGRPKMVLVAGRLLARSAPPGPTRSGARTPRRWRARSSVAATLVAGSMAIGVPAYAYFTDPVPVTGATFGTDTVPVPVISCGGNTTAAVGQRGLIINWAAVPGATQYQIVYGTTGQTNATVDGATTTWTVPAGSPETRIRVRTVRGTWSSVNSNALTFTIDGTTNPCA